MIGNKVIVDTSVFVNLIRGDKGVIRKLDSFAEVHISPVVLAELYFGAYRSAAPERSVQEVNEAIYRSSLLLIDSNTAETFVTVKLGLFAIGNPIPENDIWIASAAIQHQIPLYTNDKHFKKIDGLVLA